MVFLALIQCLVPLLHAHADGLNAASHVHMQFDPSTPFAPHVRHADEFRAVTGHSAVIGAVVEFRRDSPIDGFDAIPLAALPLPVAYPASGGVPAFFSRLPFRFVLCIPPPAQAPPISA